MADNQKKPDAYEAGQRTRQAAGTAVQLTPDKLPLQALRIGQTLGESSGILPAIRNYTAGLVGAAPQTPAAPAAPAAGIKRPDFSGVQSSVSTSQSPAPRAPAPTAQGAAAPSVGSGGSDPASRVLGTFTGSNGTRTITAGDADALASRVSTVPGAPPISSPLARPGQSPNPQYDASRLNVANIDRNAFINSIDDQISALGTPDRRSKRDLLANLLQLKGQAVGQGGQIAADLAGKELGSSTDVSTTDMRETGATNRTALGEVGANYRSDAAQAGETFRMLNRPEYQADASGAVNVIQNGVARPVQDAGGKPLRTVTATQEKAAARRQDVLDNIAKQAVEFLPVGQQPSAEAIAAARLQAAQVQGLQTATGPNGEKGVVINGELVPL